MKPEKSRITSQKSLISRGKMYVKTLSSWLPGYPVKQVQSEITWNTPPTKRNCRPQPILITREHLRKVSMVISKLTSQQYSEYLPKIIDNSEYWLERMAILIVLLKDTIYKEQALPKNLFELDGLFPDKIRKASYNINQSYPDLEPIINALSWVELLGQNNLDNKLLWLSQYGSLLSVIIRNKHDDDPVQLVLTLLEISQSKANDEIGFLLELFSKPDVSILPANQISQYFATAKKTIKTNPVETTGKPQAILRIILDNFIEWLLEQSPAHRSNAIKLLRLTFPNENIKQWHQWWYKTEQIQNKARYMAAYNPEGYAYLSKDLARDFMALRKEMPIDPKLHELFMYIKKAAINMDFWRQIIRMINMLPENNNNPFKAIALLYHWHDILKQNSPEKVIPTIKAANKYLSIHSGIPWAWNCWNDIIDRDNKRYYRWHLDDELIEDVKKIKIFFDALALYSGNNPDKTHASDDYEILVYLTRLSSDAAISCSIFGQIDKAGLFDTYITDEEIKCTYSFGSNEKDFPKILKIINKVGDDDYDSTSDLHNLQKTLIKAGHESIAGKLICDGQIQLVLEAARLLRAIKAFKLSVPAFKEKENDNANHKWIRRYPEEYHNIISLFTAHSDNPEKTVSDILDKYYACPEKLTRQIEVLKELSAQQPDDIQMQKRLSNLLQRQANPPEVSQHRRQILHKKLEKAFRRSFFAFWVSSLKMKYTKKLLDWLQLDQEYDWLFTPEQNRILLNMLKLPEQFIQLGKMIFQARCKPGPWDFRTMPENKKFLEYLVNKGINIEPWLNPVGSREFEIKNDQKITLEIEKDPLKIFQMGWHFSTCLSPDGCNFYSVFSNIVDINKQVVYAYDQNEKVVGRCLLALNSHGKILTFEPYCHDRSIGFGNVIASFAQHLAEQMQTHVSFFGKVKTLVSPKWYDDGPRDVCNRFTFLNNGSDFRKSLKNIHPNELVPKLQELFDPLPLDALSLSLIINLSELSQRPELILPLIKWIKPCKGISNSTILQAATLAYKAGNITFAQEVFRQQKEQYFIRQIQNHWSVDWNIMRIMVEINPSMALRILHQTRAKGINSDLEETHNERITIYLRAYKALGKTGKYNNLKDHLRQKKQKQST